MKNTTRFLLGATSIALLATLGLGTKASAEVLEIGGTLQSACEFTNPVIGTFAPLSGGVATELTGNATVNLICSGADSTVGITALSTTSTGTLVANITTSIDLTGADTDVLDVTAAPSATAGLGTSVNTPLTVAATLTTTDNAFAAGVYTTNVTLTATP